MKQIFIHKCAACGEYQFTYDKDLHDEREYQWVCGNCGIQMSLRFSDGGKQVDQKPTGKRCERTIALLRMRDNPSFMFIHEGFAWEGDMSSHGYHYEEGTCPTNLMPSVEIISNGETDPHGVFELVEEHLVTGPNALNREEVIRQLTALAVDKTMPSQ